MRFTESPLKGAFTIQPEPREDERGFFTRTYCRNEFEEIGHSREFVQFNHSMTLKRGTLRGLHYQLPPASEIKLIRCVSGEVFDVIIDIREGSPTFLVHFGVILSAENMTMIYVPEGFAHGFQTLADRTHMIYHHTAFYEPGHERGLHYSDPALGIKWPLEPLHISDKDREHPFINNHFTGITI